MFPNTFFFEDFVFLNFFSVTAEAMDFRDWCESETVRLTGSKGIRLLNLFIIYVFWVLKTKIC